ncbi:MAG: hypothetical protein ACPGVU_13015 [Limisphaerales bacterium]
MNEPVTDPDADPVPVESTALKWAKNIAIGTFRVVGYGSIAVVAIGVLTPVTCRGAQSSARLEWLERDQLIEDVIRDESKQPPEQP